MASEALMHTDLPGLKLISRGKVRDIYATSSPDTLLFVATDRISAYDVILQNVRTSSTTLSDLVLNVFFVFTNNQPDPKPTASTHVYIYVGNSLERLPSNHPLSLLVLQALSHHP
jgi:hypothetical protein